MQIRHLQPADLSLIAEIDRSEEVRVGYSVEDGALVTHEVDWRVPPWSRDGDGEHSVQSKIEPWGPVLARGGEMFGAFEGDALAGLVIVEPGFEPGLAWLAFLHVSRPYRRSGVAAALWAEAERPAKEAGATEMYVSATPSGSAVGFYLSRGCRLAARPHPVLYEMEPEDIHLICAL